MQFAQIPVAPVSHWKVKHFKYVARLSNGIELLDETFGLTFQLKKRGGGREILWIYSVLLVSVRWREKAKTRVDLTHAPGTNGT